MKASSSSWLLFVWILLSTLSIVLIDAQETVTETKTAQTVDAQEEEVADLDQLLKEAEEAEAIKEGPQTNNVTQSGPLIDLLGPTLWSFNMIDETHAAIAEHETNDVLNEKPVIGLYFSAEWCNPCRQFTPQLVSFRDKMNGRRGKKDQFQIVWVSRSRSQEGFLEYFSHMPGFYALPLEEALGERGQQLGAKYGVRGIPSLILLDEAGNVITKDARNKIPQDRAGLAFPWRHPVSSLCRVLFPKPFRAVVKTQLIQTQQMVVRQLKALLGIKKQTTSSQQQETTAAVAA